MEKPNYVEAKIRGDLLRTVDQRHERWVALASALLTCLQQKTKWSGWGIQEMGYPSREHFDLLERRNPDGNCWYAKVRFRGNDRWLLWFGFRSDVATELLGDSQSWPSIFIAERTDRPDAVHPYETDFERESSTEIIIRPGASKPALLRRGYTVESLQVDELAAALVAQLCR